MCQSPVILAQVSTVPRSLTALQGKPPVCFTGSFKEGGWYDETSMAQTMARHNGSDHIVIAINRNDLTRALDNLVYCSTNRAWEWAHWFSIAWPNVWRKLTR